MNKSAKNKSSCLVAGYKSQPAVLTPTLARLSWNVLRKATLTTATSQNQTWLHTTSRRNGLTFELNISNGYCAGGKWIDPEHAMQRVKAAEMVMVKGSDGEWLTERGDLNILGPEGYVSDIALIAMPCRDDGKMRHVTARYNAKGKGRNGAMQGPLGKNGDNFTGYGFTTLPDVGTLQVSDDSTVWRDVAALGPMYRSQGGYFVRTTAFPATEGKFWRVCPVGDASLKEWHVGGEAMLDRWEERTALHSDFAEGEETPDYLPSEVVNPQENVVCLFLIVLLRTRFLFSISGLIRRERIQRTVGFIYQTRTWFFIV